ncbi:endonuclease-reverse transcriptase [Plakobranchus ocellatus]|uniref:Endonuclease-reverse transcriptase n=1 Tax=Plakobranchus ocellatus TaxID=259542 RepID=A0AAV4C2D1_9GAST|nr:endonuclease-reverse transcriptase [Plakobranchus ocellatus]
MGYRPISSRLTSIQIKASPFNITIVQAYAPTIDHDVKELEEFYVQIQRAFGEVPKKNIIVVKGEDAYKGKVSDILAAIKDRDLWRDMIANAYKQGT